MKRRANLRIVEGNSMKPKKPAPRGLPAPPEGLPDALHADWFAICRDLKKRKELKPTVLTVVRTYCAALATAAECERSILRDGPSVRTGSGGLKPHPATGLLRSSRESIARLAAELGLTPASRARKAPATKPAAQSNKWGL